MRNGPTKTLAVAHQFHFSRLTYSAIIAGGGAGSVVWLGGRVCFGDGVEIGQGALAEPLWIACRHHPQQISGDGIGASASSRSGCSSSSAPSPSSAPWWPLDPRSGMAEIAGVTKKSIMCLSSLEAGQFRDAV
jgi:hypothetical protein